MNFQPLDSKSPDELAEIWAKSHLRRFLIDGPMFKRQVLDSPLFASDLSFVCDEGFIALKAPAVPTLFPGNPSGAHHISALACPDSADALIAHTIQAAKAQGIVKLVFGMDHDHIFPGCPIDEVKLASQLENAGFTKGPGLANDLQRDMLDYEVPEDSLDCLTELGFEVRPADDEDEAALDTFLQETFPGRWHHDVMRKFRVSGEAHQIDVLMQGHECFGFSLTQDSSTQHPCGGGVWHLDLGENWASLGPIGISAKVRGMGLGGAILGASLSRLRDEGARQTIIDWTSLVDFYGMHGFHVTRQYASYSLEL